MEKEIWKGHRDRYGQSSGVHAAYNGRHWWIGQLQSKLDTIARKHARHEKKALHIRTKLNGTGLYSQRKSTLKGETK